MSATRQALILEPGSPRPDADIGRVLATELGLFPADAIARVRYGGGIVIAGGENEVVRRVGDLLREMGVQVRIVPAELLGGVPRAHRACGLELLDEVISVRSPGGRELLILESDLRGIHVHALRAEAPPPRSAAGPMRVPVFSALREGAITKRGLRILGWIEDTGQPPPRFVLTLYVRDPVGPVRFERDSTDYSVLGAAKQRHSIDNFILLVELIVERYHDLRNREQAVGFLQSLDPGEILCYKQEEVQNFDRWMQAWIRLEDTTRIAGDGEDRQRS